MKQQDLSFACIQGGEMSNFKSRKNRANSLFGSISFYRTYYFCKRHDMIQCTTFKNIYIFLNACNLGHFILEPLEPTTHHNSSENNMGATKISNNFWCNIKLVVFLSLLQY